MNYKELVDNMSEEDFELLYELVEERMEKGYDNLKFDYKRKGIPIKAKIVNVIEKYDNLIIDDTCECDYYVDIPDKVTIIPVEQIEQ